MKSAVSSVDIQKVSGSDLSETQDLVVSEEPLEIRLKFHNGVDFIEKRLAVTMRTPGHDFELATGFLLTEGIIQSYNDVDKLFYCVEIKAKEEEGNVLIVVLNQDVKVSESIFERNFYVNSSCGVCGKSSLESVHTICDVKLPSNAPKINAGMVHDIPNIARAQQDVFKYTGGLHASVLLNTKGEILFVREDVGRHNALDKMIGAMASSKTESNDKILFVSGRAGFELVQKCIAGGIPIMIAVGAPSSLAVELAKEYELTLIGFARGDKFNVYAGKDRIIF